MLLPLLAFDAAALSKEVAVGIWRSPKAEPLLALFCMALFSSTAMCLFLAEMWADWNGNWLGCRIITIVYFLNYVGCKMAEYGFLFFRAKVVIKALRMNKGNIKRLMNVVLFCITFGVAGAFLFGPFVVFDAYVGPEHHCVNLANALFEPFMIAFIEIDLNINVMLLLLFALPLVRTRTALVSLPHVA